MDTAESLNSVKTRVRQCEKYTEKLVNLVTENSNYVLTLQSEETNESRLSNVNPKYA